MACWRRRMRHGIYDRAGINRSVRRRRTNRHSSPNKSSYVGSFWPAFFLNTSAEQERAIQRVVSLPSAGLPANQNDYGATKPTLAWLPSQNGLFALWPQRHKRALVTRATTRPVPLVISRLPRICNGPLICRSICSGPSRTVSISVSASRRGCWPCWDGLLATVCTAWSVFAEICRLRGRLRRWVRQAIRRARSGNSACGASACCGRMPRARARATASLREQASSFDRMPAR